MDVNKALRELHEEKRRLDVTIAALEARLGNGTRRNRRRGRKSMSAEERQEVSRRMSKYWEARRAATAALPAGAGLPLDAQESRFDAQSQTRSAIAGGSLSA
jgi:hypothetical protein